MSTAPGNLYKCEFPRKPSVHLADLPLPQSAAKLRRRNPWHSFWQRPGGLSAARRANAIVPTRSAHIRSRQVVGRVPHRLGVDRYNPPDPTPPATSTQSIIEQRLASWSDFIVRVR